MDKYQKLSTVSLYSISKCFLKNKERFGGRFSFLFKNLQMEPLQVLGNFIGESLRFKIMDEYDDEKVKN